MSGTHAPGRCRGVVCRLAMLAVTLAVASTAAFGTTWVVEGTAANAADSQPGTAAEPLKTIEAAMRRLKAGDEVVIGDGIYREAVVVPALHGTAVTTVRARRPGAAIVRGSDLVTGWTSDPAGRQSVDWSGRPEPEQVFVGGVPLRQVGGTVFGGYPTMPGHELAPAHRGEGGVWLGRVPGNAAMLAPGDFFFDPVLQRLTIRRPEAPGAAQAAVEVATRPYVFRAEGVERLQVEGLVFEHANTSSLARQGAVKVFGDDNVLRNVVIRQMDAIGLQLFGTGSALIDSRIEDCGQMGLNARGRRLTIAGNRILRNNTRGFNKWWEAGGIKIVGDAGLHDSVIRDNVVAFNRGDGIWIDWMNTDIRISGNVVAFNAGFGIHYEASQRGWIDGNASYGNLQRGIYVLESSDTRVEDNVVAANGLEGIVVADGERSGQNPQLKPRHNRVTGNVIGWNKDVELMLAQPTMGSFSDHNTFIAATPPGMVEGWTAALNRPARGLANWTARSGMDRHGDERIAPLPAALEQILRDGTLVGVDALRAMLAVPVQRR